MQIDFLAHACFLLTDDRGVRVMLDPYESGGFSGRVGYAPITDAPDVVVITHDHLDHSHTATLPGAFDVLRMDGEARGITARSVQAFHDEQYGERFGGVIDMKVVGIDGLSVCHCGDLGEQLRPHQLEALGAVDVLIVPTGGYYTLGPDGAAAVARAVAPRWIVPCHYKTDRCGFDIAPVDPFLAHFDRVIRAESSTWRIERSTLPDEPTVLLLDMRL